MKSRFSTKSSKNSQKSGITSPEQTETGPPVADPSINATGHSMAIYKNIFLRGGVMYPLAIVIILWAGTILYLDAKRRDTMDHARRNTETIVKGFSEQIRILSADLDRMLLFFRQIIEVDSKSQSLGQITKSAAFREDLVLQIASMDENGIVTDSNLGRPKTPVNLSDRPHFRIHKEGKDDLLYISDPVRGRVSGKSSIQFSRKIIGLKGAFRGVIVASVSPEKLSSYYNSINLGGDGVITLFNKRAIILARSSVDPEKDIGRSLAASPAVRAFLSTGNRCELITSILDRIEKFTCFQNVAGFPLGVAVAIPLSSIMAPLEREKSTLLMINTGITILAMIAFAISFRRERQLQLAAISIKTANAMAQKRTIELESTLKSIDQGIAMFDISQKQVFANRRARQFRQSYPELTQEIESVIAASKSMEPEPSLTWDLLVAQRELTNNHGQYLEVRFFRAPRDSMVVTMSDVTASRAARKALEQSLEAERRSAESVKRFLAIMSHEIRTPLHTILGFSDMIAKTNLSPEQREYLAFITNPAEHLKSLMSDILDFTYMESGQTRLHLAPVRTPDLIARLQGMGTALLEKKPLDIRYNFSPDLPEFFVGDEQRIIQLIGNLMSNAIKYTDAGSVSLSATAHHISGSQVELCFAIADSGIGISESEISNLFQPFVRGEKVMNVHEGTGLGLAICKRIVRMFKGDMTIESKLGKGSTFSVRFLVELETPLTLNAPNDLNERLPSFDILVAEDNASNRLLILKMLEALGQRVIAVENGVEAVRQARTGRFDIIILDIQMPMLDGVSAAREISRIIEGEAQKPVMAALTAQVLDVDRNRAENAGLSVFLEKPLREAALRRFISSCASGRK